MTTADLRSATYGGLAIAIAIGAWWLGATRLALADGADTARIAADALSMLWFVRGAAVAVLATRAAAARGWTAGVAIALGVVTPSWPALALAWSASASSAMQVVLAEAALIAAALALPLVGAALRRLPKVPAPPLGTACGVALAAALWMARPAWLPPVV